MFRIGIIGTENSHAMAFSKAINLPQENGEMRYPDARVVGVYGPDLESANKIMEETGVDFLASSPDDFFGKVDAMIVTCRKGSLHNQYARPFIEKGIPTFVDKPITADLDESRALMTLAKEKGVPVTGGSGCKLAYDVLLLQNTAKQWKASGDLITGTINFAADPDSEYDGFFFYSSHLTEMALTVFGYDPMSVMAFEKNRNRVCVLRYENFDVTLNYTVGTHETTGLLIGKGGNLVRNIDISMIYLQEVDEFIQMLRTGKMPFTYEQLILPVAVISAVEESVKTGREVAIRSCEI